MSAVDTRRNRRRPSASALWAAAAVWLLSLCSLPPGSSAVRPSDHGLALQKNTTKPSPAMVDFFRGGRGRALPQAKNATDAIWDLSGRAAPGDGGEAAGMFDGRDRARTVLLTAGVVCGAVGVALLAAAAVAYLIQSRRRETSCGGG